MPTAPDTDADTEYHRWKRPLAYGWLLTLGVVAVLHWLPG